MPSPDLSPEPDAEARYRFMADSMPQIAWTARADGSVEHYNQTWYEYSGLTLEETRDWGWRVLHPDDVERTIQARTAAIAAGTVSEVEYRLRRHDGQFRWHLGRSLPIKGGNGEIVAWVGTATDIQKRVEAEAHARHAARALDAASDAYVTLDRDYRITYVNAESARINKKPAEAFLGRLHWEEWPASIGTEFEKQFRRAMTERITVQFLERYYVPGQYDDWIDVTVYPAAEEDGGGIHLMYRDVSERIQRERREQFLAGLAERARTLTDPDAVLADAVQSVGKFLDVSRCTFADIDVNADTCTIHLDYCADETVRSITGVLPWSAFGQAVSDELAAGRAVVVDDVRDDPAHVRSENVAAYDAIGIRAHVTAPVVHSARLVSCISVQNATPRRWLAHEVELLQAVVERTWLTVEVARQGQALREEVEQRREQGEFLRRILESSPDCIKTLDLDGNLVAMTEGGQKSMEVDDFGSLCGMEWATFWQGETRDLLYAAVVKAKAGGMGRFQGFCRTMKGTPKWWDVVVSPILGADGLPEQLLAVSRDISDQKKGELERERLLADTRAHAERETLLNQIGAAVRAATEPEAILQAAVSLLGRGLHADRCYLARYNQIRDTARVFPEWMGDGLDLEPLSGRTFQMSLFSVDRDAAYREGRTHVVDDVAAYAPEDTAPLAAISVRAILRVPIAVGNQMTALAVAMAQKPRQWTSDEVRLVENVAILIRSALETAYVQQRERNISQQLQAALQPPPPQNLPGLALEGFYRPALAEAGVGGDAYDVFPVKQDCTALVVFDLAGKGLAAASQVATVRNMLRYSLYTSATVAGTVTTLNRVLAEQNLLTGFATLFVGMYDQAARTLTYTNCGQEPGLLWRAATGVVVPLHATGPVLGGFGDGEFTEEVVLLAPGDVLALFTDGLTEVGPSRKDLLEVEGVARLFHASCGAGSASEPNTPQSVVAALVASVDAFAGGGVRDDIALLVGVVGADDDKEANGKRNGND